jgi:hypothetical protein
MDKISFVTVQLRSLLCRAHCAIVAALLFQFVGFGSVNRFLLGSGYSGDAYLALALNRAGLIGWQAVLSRRRFFKRKIIPLIMQSIGSLRTTEREVEMVLTEFARR